MSELTSLWPSMPAYIAIPVILIGFLLARSPSAISVYEAISKDNRNHRKLRRDLELRKLALEIEAIEKEHSLGQYGETKTPDISSMLEKIEIQSASIRGESAEKLPGKTRFWLGAAGGVLPIFVDILFGQLSRSLAILSEPFEITLVVGVWLALFGGFSGLATKGFAPERASPLTCLFFGFATAAVFSLIGNFKS